MWVCVYAFGGLLQAAAPVLVPQRAPLPMDMDAAAAATAADAAFKLGVVEVERRIVRTFIQSSSYHSSSDGSRGDNTADGGDALRLCHQPVRLAEVAAIGPALAAHPHVKTLAVSHACLDDAAVHALVPLLQVSVLNTPYDTIARAGSCPWRCRGTDGCSRDRVAERLVSG